MINPGSANLSGAPGKIARTEAFKEGAARAEALADEVLGGSLRAASRLITLLENESPGVEAALSKLYPHTGRALVIGVTGTFGAGKSCLIDRIAAEYARQNKQVGILAVDPSSPLTGGAVLGDRIRMSHAGQSSNVYIRSLASRGEVGGLSKVISAAINVLDGYGKDIIIVETLGVGQDEVEIMRVADVILLTMVPNLGDAIQLMKAGIMEIGNIVVVNKSDLPGAEQLCGNLRTTFHPDANKSEHWVPVIVPTVAVKNQGITAVIEAVDQYVQHAKSSGQFLRHRKEIARLDVMKAITDKIARRVEAVISSDSFDSIAEDLAHRRLEMQACVDQVVNSIIR